MNYLQHKKNIMLLSSNTPVKKVLSENFVLEGSTQLIYKEGMEQCSYLYPKELKTTGDNGFIEFEIDGVKIKFPIEKPMYSGDKVDLYSEFMYKDGKWGIYYPVNAISYDGTEEWFEINSCTFAVKSPDDMLKMNFNNQYDWLDSTITNKHTSYMTTYQYDNCISYGTENMGIRIDNTVTDVEQFKDILKDLYAEGTPFTVLYKLEEPVWYVLPDDVQKYLNKFLI